MTIGFFIYLLCVLNIADCVNHFDSTVKNYNFPRNMNLCELSKAHTGSLYNFTCPSLFPTYYFPR